jgi:hypothetical protein
VKTFILVITMTFFSLPVLAETYIWEDDQGTVNFAEDLGNVPKKFRKKVRIIGGEESPPAAVKEGKEKPPLQHKESVPVAKPDQMRVYGGKNADAWKSEFTVVNADLKATEKQLVEYRNRVKDTSRMSRSEYLGIQSTIKTIELSVLDQRKKLNDLQQAAEKAGVPAELME